MRLRIRRKKNPAYEVAKRQLKATKKKDKLYEELYRELKRLEKLWESE